MLMQKVMTSLDSFSTQVNLSEALMSSPVGDGNDHVVDLAVLQRGDGGGVILDHVPGDSLDLGLAAVIVLKKATALQEVMGL